VRRQRVLQKDRDDGEADVEAQQRDEGGRVRVAGGEAVEEHDERYQRDRDEARVPVVPCPRRLLRGDVDVEAFEALAKGCFFI
jgi:hypothetical protein